MISSLVKELLRIEASGAAIVKVMEAREWGRQAAEALSCRLNQDVSDEEFEDYINNQRKLRNVRYPRDGT